MNTISSNPCMLTDVSLVGYPAEGTEYGDSVDDVIEQKIAATLPEIPGLVEGLSSEDRLAVMNAEIVRSQAAFIALHGDAFGCESDVKKGDKQEDFALPSTLSVDTALSFTC